MHTRLLLMRSAVSDSEPIQRQFTAVFDYYIFVYSLLRLLLLLLAYYYYYYYYYYKLLSLYHVWGNQDEIIFYIEPYYAKRKYKSLNVSNVQCRQNIGYL